MEREKVERLLLHIFCKELLPKAATQLFKSNRSAYEITGILIAEIRRRGVLIKRLKEINRKLSIEKSLLAQVTLIDLLQAASKKGEETK